MSVELLFTGTAALVAVAAPPIFIRALKANAGLAFFGSIIAANTISEIVFRLAKPDFHYGPLSGLAVIMNIAITLVLAALSVAVSAILLDSIDNKEKQR